MKIVESESESSEALKSWISTLSSQDEDSFLSSLFSKAIWDFEDLETLTPVAPLLNKIDSLLKYPYTSQTYSKLEVLLSFTILLLKSSSVRSEYSSVPELIDLLDTPSWKITKKILQILNLVLPQVKPELFPINLLEKKLFSMILFGLPFKILDFSLKKLIFSKPFEENSLKTSEVPLQQVFENKLDLNLTIENSSDFVTCKVLATQVFFSTSRFKNLVDFCIENNLNTFLFDDLADLVRMNLGAEFSSECLNLIGKTLSLIEQRRLVTSEKFNFNIHERLNVWSRLVVEILKSLTAASFYPQDEVFIVSVLELVPLTSRYVQGNLPSEYPLFSIHLMSFLQKLSDEGRSPDLMSQVILQMFGLLKRNLQLLRENNVTGVFIQLISKTIQNFLNSFLDEDFLRKTGKLLKNALKFFKILVDRWEEVYGGLDDMTQMILETGFIEKITEIFANCLYEFYEDSLLIIFQIVQNSFSQEYNRLMAQMIKYLLSSIGKRFPTNIRQVDILGRFLCGVPTETQEIPRMIEDSQAVKTMIQVIGCSPQSISSAHFSQGILESIQDLVLSLPKFSDQITEGICELLISLQSESSREVFFTKVSNIGTLLCSLLHKSSEHTRKFFTCQGLELIIEAFQLKFKPRSLNNELYKLNTFLKTVVDNEISNLVFKRFLTEINKSLEKLVYFIQILPNSEEIEEEFFDQVVFLDLFVDGLRTLGNKWAGANANCKEIVELMLKLADVQRFLIQMQAEKLDLSNESVLKSFVVSPELGILESQDLKTAKENWLFMCQLSIRRLFKAVIKIPNNKVKSEVINEYSLQIGKTLSQIMNDSFRQIEFSSANPCKCYYFALLLSDIIKLIYSEPMSQSFPLLSFLFDEGSENIPNLLKSLQDYSKTIQNTTLSFHSVNSLQILWSLTGKLLENFANEKFSNINLSIIKAFGYSSSKDLNKKLKEVLLKSLKEVQYLEAGQFSLNFAKSVLAILKILTSKPKEISAVDPSCLEALTNMGFTLNQARQALIAVGRNSVESATEWIFNNPDKVLIPVEENPEDQVFTQEIFQQVLDAIPVIPALSQIIAECLTQMIFQQESLCIQLVRNIWKKTENWFFCLRNGNLDFSSEQLEGFLNVLVMVVMRNTVVFEEARNLKVVLNAVRFLNWVDFKGLSDKWVGHLLALVDYVAKTGQEGCFETIGGIVQILRIHNESMAFTGKSLNSLICCINGLLSNLDLVKIFIDLGGVKELILLKSPSDKSDIVSQNKIWVKLFTKLLKDPSVLFHSFQLKLLQKSRKVQKLSDLLRSSPKELNRSSTIFFDSIKSCVDFSKNSGILMITQKKSLKHQDHPKWSTIQDFCDCLSVIFDSDTRGSKQFVLNSNNFLDLLSMTLDRCPVLISRFLSTKFTTVDPKSLEVHSGNLISNLVKVMIPFRYALVLPNLNYLLPGSDSALPQATYDHWLGVNIKILSQLGLHHSQKFYQKEINLEVFNIDQGSGLNDLVDEFTSAICLNLTQNLNRTSHATAVMRIIPEILAELLLVSCPFDRPEVSNNSKLPLNPRQPNHPCNCLFLARKLSSQSSGLLEILSSVFNSADFFEYPSKVIQNIQKLFELLLRYSMNSSLKNDLKWELLRSSDFITFKTHFMQEPIVSNEAPLLAEEDSPLMFGDDAFDDDLASVRGDRTNERELLESLPHSDINRIFPASSGTVIFDESVFRTSHLLRLEDDEMMNLILTNRNRLALPVNDSIPEKPVKRLFRDFQQEIQDFLKKCEEEVVENLQIQEENMKASSSENPSQSNQFSDIDPDFLNALPEDIRSEVMETLSRGEEVINRNDFANVDFVNSLDPDLRREVLATASEDVINSLPEDMAAEAHTLQERLRIRPKPHLRTQPVVRNNCSAGFEVLKDENISEYLKSVFKMKNHGIGLMFEGFTKNVLNVKLFALTLLSLSGNPLNLEEILYFMIGLIASNRHLEDVINILLFLSKFNPRVKQVLLEGDPPELEKIVDLAEVDFFSSSSNALTILLKLINRILKASEGKRLSISRQSLLKLTQVLKQRNLSQKALSKLASILNILSQNPEIKESLLSELQYFLVTISKEIQEKLDKTSFQEITQESQVFRHCEVIRNISGSCHIIDFLWAPLSDFISGLGQSPSDEQVLKKLLPLIQAFFICQRLEESSKSLLYFSQSCSDQLNFLIKSNFSLLDSSLKILTKEFSFLMNFENKRFYFVSRLKDYKRDKAHGSLRLNVRRTDVFTDSFHQLKGKTPEEMQCKLRVQFANEDGIDAGGLAREWFGLLSREMFNPNYALFIPSPNGATFQPNSMSGVNQDHLQFFKFVGRIVGKAISDGYTLDVYFTRSFYKHILGQEVSYQDMEDIDVGFYKNLKSLVDINLAENDLHEYYFCYEEQEFGTVTVKELIPSGNTIKVTESNKLEYIKLLCHMKMTQNIQSQIEAFKTGFYEIVSHELISIFTSKELELLIAGLPTFDVEDLKRNTEYYNYNKESVVITWFWKVLHQFNLEERAEFLQFVTGSSKVPIEGFKALPGMDGPQKFQIHKCFASKERLPTAHTCINQLDLPEYSSEEELRSKLVLAIKEGNEGFGFA